MRQGVDTLYILWPEEKESIHAPNVTSSPQVSEREGDTRSGEELSLAVLTNNLLPDGLAVEGWLVCVGKGE